MAGQHRAPTNTRRNLQRAATGGVASLALLGFARSADAAPELERAPVLERVPITPAAAPVTRQAPALERAPKEQAYVVQSGDWLSSIAQDRLGTADWRALYDQNRDVIGADPDLIFPGQTLHFVGGTLLPTPPTPVPAEQPAPPPPPAAAPVASTVHAPIVNSAGPVHARTQAAADAVFANVPGAQLITLGGTRGSAIDPHGHPSGNAIDYMVMADLALGDAIVAYTVAHWNDLGVEYIIWQQRILLSQGGSWELMEDRGSPTQNHRDHVHVNYLP